jgi:hypothetical protein
MVVIVHTATTHTNTFLNNFMCYPPCEQFFVYTFSLNPSTWHLPFIDLVADVFFDFPKCELCQKYIAIIKTTTFKKYNNTNTVTFFECKCLYIKDLS